MINVLLVDLGTPRDEISEPLGIETLASYIEDEFSDEISLEIKSIELDNCSSIDSYIKNKFYSVIGLSTKIRSYDRFKNIMNTIREKTPESIVVVGDILGTYTFEEVLSNYPNVICVRGEGEDAMKELVRFALNPSEVLLSNIPNLAYISDDKLVLTSRITTDLSKAKHPDRTLALEVFNQNGIVRLEASRGCAYSKCDFCGTVEKYNGPGWRPFNLDFIIEELIIISKIGFKSPYFTDEDFFGDDIKRVYELADKIEDAKKNNLVSPDLDFYINLRANSILGMGIGGKQEATKLLLRLKEVGLREIFVGIESGCGEQLYRYKKGITKENNIEAIRTLRDLGIEGDLGFIFFDKDSSITDLRENLNFIYEANISYQDSQLIKRMRIEPRTPLGFDFAKQNPTAQIDLNIVEFLYQFRHVKVEKIYNTFINWQKEDLDVVYNLQSFCRGEISEGYTRKEIKEILSQYRNLDVRYLDEIIKIFETDRQNEDESIRDVTQNFEEIRNNLDNNLIDRIQWIDSNFRRFRI